MGYILNLKYTEMSFIKCFL